MKNGLIAEQLNYYKCNKNGEIVILNKLACNSGIDSFTYEAIIIIRCYIFQINSTI